MSSYHVSVLLNESIENLVTRPDGNYVDATFGAGGHSRSILSKLNAKGRLYAFDQDVDVLANVPEDERLTLVESNFRYIKPWLRYHGVNGVDGIMADLGVSSHQLDMPERGFSYRFDAPLDMRMNIESDLTAEQVVQTYSEEALLEMLSQYGEVRNSRTLAKGIVQARSQMRLKTTFDFNHLLDSYVVGPRMKYLSQVYQAVRMEVNDEIGALKDLLSEGADILKPGGRFVVITFHSIEDRIVKNFFKTGQFDGRFIQDDFGVIHRPFRLVHKSVITAGKEEIKSNVRSRSAKLRVAEKI